MEPESDPLAADGVVLEAEIATRRPACRHHVQHDVRQLNALRGSFFASPVPRSRKPCSTAANASGIDRRDWTSSSRKYRTDKRSLGRTRRRVHKARGEDHGLCCRYEVDVEVKRSVNWNRPSRSTPAPVLMSTSCRSTGPPYTKVWNSPFSPHGSTPTGKASRKEWSNRRPLKVAANCIVSTQATTAR